MLAVAEKIGEADHHFTCCLIAAPCGGSWWCPEKNRSADGIAGGRRTEECRGAGGAAGGAG